jgi:putative ABC transport system ATP-binding protein
MGLRVPGLAVWSTCGDRGRDQRCHAALCCRHVAADLAPSCNAPVGSRLLPVGCSAVNGFVSFRHVTKHYLLGKHVVEVLRDVDLEIAQGSFVAVMGPSGSGKTTLLNLAGALDHPTAGDVRVGGEDIGRMSAGAAARWRARTVGFVFQSYNLMPGMTAAENVELPLLTKRLSSKERKRNIDIALELVGLVERAKFMPHQLSGGQQQRVAIARAVVADPRLLICDEPTGDLDRETADDVLGLLQVLNAELGKTIVMATHDPLAAARASRLIRLDKGVLLDVGR